MIWVISQFISTPLKKTKFGSLRHQPLSDHRNRKIHWMRRLIWDFNRRNLGSGKCGLSNDLDRICKCDFGQGFTIGEHFVLNGSDCAGDPHGFQFLMPVKMHGGRWKQLPPTQQWLNAFSDAKSWSVLPPFDLNDAIHMSSCMMELYTHSACLSGLSSHLLPNAWRGVDLDNWPLLKRQLWYSHLLSRLVLYLLCFPVSNPVFNSIHIYPLTWPSLYSFVLSLDE